MPSPRRSRKDLFVTAGFALVAVAIAVNALFLQKGPHPAPIFANKPAPQPALASERAMTLPRPRPAEPEQAKIETPAPQRPRAEIVTDIQRELARRGFYDGNPDGAYGPKTDAAIRDFEQIAGLKVGGEPNEAMLRAIAQSKAKATPDGAATIVAASAGPATATSAPRPPDPIGGLLAPSKNIVAVQRVLGEYGYGQIEPNGVMDRDTHTAIEQFERARSLPVTGQISPRLLRELAALSGRPLE